MKKIGVVGVGYVGLTQAVGMAQLGHSVIAYDVNSKKIQKLKTYQAPFYEPGVSEALKEQKSQITFTEDIEDLFSAEFIFLCLPTPQSEDGSADTSFLEAAVNSLVPFLTSDTFLIVKSTVPVTLGRHLNRIVRESGTEIISNPEFLREGSALLDFHKPDRIVIGASSELAALKVKELYKSVDTEFILTDNTSAELIKYAANAFLAMKLSFVNDIAALCEDLEANSNDVLNGVGLDKRIGHGFLKPGPGWGGSCFPKDVRALLKLAEEKDFSLPLLDAALESNLNAKLRVINKIDKYSKIFNLKNIAVWGLSFKANTDDVRNSPSLYIVKELIDLGFSIKCYDPVVKNIENIPSAKSIEESVLDCDLIIVLTEWSNFHSVNVDKISGLVRSKFILDTRQIIDKELWSKHGFNIL